MPSSTRRTVRRGTSAAVVLLSFLVARDLIAQQNPGGVPYRTPYADIPRIETHSHVSDDTDSISNYHALRKSMLEQHGIDLAMWINLGDKHRPIPDYEKVVDAGRGRMLCCIADYSAHDGLAYTPAELAAFQNKGYIGYKIWAGPPSRRLKPGEPGYPYIDDPAHDSTFQKLEEIGMACASIHIADPNGPFAHRTQWLPDPVEFWREMMAYRNRIEKHPKLTFVTAHAMWSICQDAQIDYLRYMLSTHPNLYIDLAATFQYFHLVSRDNLRDFMIEYSDRIMFGTDVGSWNSTEQTPEYVQRYVRCFRILETGEMVDGGFFGGVQVRGLELPRQALENIYFRSAAQAYPRVKQQLLELGYKVN